MSESANNAAEPAKLRRALTLPWLVFYGLGVTIGAGIFALIGEILALAGDAAAFSFFISGLIAAATGISYALLVRVFPRAGGEAVFVHRGLGPRLGQLVGLGVAATGIISSAAIALAFAGYASSLVDVPKFVLVVAILALLTAIAWWGVRESVVFAAVVTCLEVGTLVVVIAFGLPLLENLPSPTQLLGLETGFSGLVPVMSGAIIAFFAFVGFEDIENMAEETVNPEYTAPRAIIWTLTLTVLIYMALAFVAVSVPGRDAITASSAPLAVLFESVTGMSGKPVSAMASIAMVNGILVQIIMSARVLYGMANEGLMPRWFGVVDKKRRTPARATLFVSAIILLLAATLPLVRLAEITSIVILIVFALVNLSLFTLGRSHGDKTLHRWRYFGILGASLCAGILAFHLFGGQLGGH